MNLRVNFDKNKKASRIKALREFAMKRLTDFFEEKGWKTGKMGYNENRKRSKYCGWTVPMRDWNILYKSIKYPFFYFVEPYLWEIETLDSCSWLSPPFVEPYLWEIETQDIIKNAHQMIVGWTVPMRDWNLFFRDESEYLLSTSLLNRTYERLKHNHIVSYLLHNVWSLGWTVPMSDILLLLNSLFYTNTMNCFVNLQRRYE